MTAENGENQMINQGHIGSKLWQTSLTLKLMFNLIHLLYQYNCHDAYSIKDRNYVCLELKKKKQPQSQPQSILTISESLELKAQVFCFFFLCVPQTMVMSSLISLLSIMFVEHLIGLLKHQVSLSLFFR